MHAVTLRKSMAGLLLLAAAIPAANLSGQTTRSVAGTSTVGPNGEIVLSGSTEPFAKIEVPAAIRGVLAEVVVKEGQAVKKDEPLARIDDALQRAEVALAEMKAHSTAEIEGAQNQIDFAKNAVELMRTHGSATELREKELSYKQAVLTLAVQTEAQKMSAVKLQQEQITLARMTLHSPIDGFVLRVHKQAGEMTDEGPVITVVQTNKLSAIFFPPKELFGQIKVGDRVPLEFEAERREGVVTAVDPTLSSGLFRVKLEVENGDAKIPAGINAKWVVGRR